MIRTNGNRSEQRTQGPDGVQLLCDGIAALPALSLVSISSYMDFEALEEKKEERAMAGLHYHSFGIIYGLRSLYADSRRRWVGRVN